MLNSDVGHGRKVLVVDDVRIIADTLALILTQSGFESSVAYSGEDALQSAFETKPDILITDVLMGKLSGIDLAKFFHDRLPECRVILFSGQIATEGLLQSAKVEGYEFEALPKPVSPRLFLDLLSEAPLKPAPLY